MHSRQERLVIFFIDKGFINMVLHQNGSPSFMKLVQYKVIPGYSHVGEKMFPHKSESSCSHVFVKETYFLP